ncbi:hypothetical protein AO715_08165 [Xanthomonas sp. Mitacek01]|nr:hypothetical protein AO715_08165 [Xanthomonas sp. Mitacek01]
MPVVRSRDAATAARDVLMWGGSYRPSFEVDGKAAFGRPFLFDVNCGAGLRLGFEPSPARRGRVGWGQTFTSLRERAKAIRHRV